MGLITPLWLFLGQKVAGVGDRPTRPTDPLRLAGSTLKCEVCFGDALQKATSDGGFFGLEDGWGEDSLPRVEKIVFERSHFL